jgi:hypothetical protein
MKMFVPEYFDEFDELLSNLSRLILEDPSDPEKLYSDILERMLRLTYSNPELKNQGANVMFYRSSIEQIFKEEASTEGKINFYDSLRNERKQMEVFFKSFKF